MATKKYEITLYISEAQKVKIYAPPCIDLALQIINSNTELLKFSDYSDVAVQIINGNLQESYWAGGSNVNASVQYSGVGGNLGTIYKASSSISMAIDGVAIVQFDTSIANNSSDQLRIYLNDDGFVSYNFLNYQAETNYQFSYTDGSSSVDINFTPHNYTCPVGTIPNPPENPENNTLPPELNCDGDLWRSAVELNFDIITREPIVLEKFDFGDNINKVPFPGKNDPLQLYDYTGTEAINQWLVSPPDGKPIIVDDVELSDPYGVQIKSNDSQLQVKSNRTNNQWVNPNLL